MCFDCARAERRTEYGKTGILTSSILTDAAIYEVRREYGEEQDFLLDRAMREIAPVRAACKTFEALVWFGDRPGSERGLQPIVRAASHRGFRVAFAADGVQCRALVWSCAGRTVFTFEPEDESYQVSLITAEDETKPVMGIQGICATSAQAVGILRAATSLRASDFIRDDKIGML